MIEAVGETGLAAAVSALEPTVLARHGGTTPFMKQACTFRLLYTLHSMVGIDSAECSSSIRTHSK